MSFGLTLALSFYFVICFLMCAFILANEDGESISSSSPVSSVRSSQKDSIITYTIAGFAFLFLCTCILISRSIRSSFVLNKLVDEAPVLIKKETPVNQNIAFDSSKLLNPVSALEIEGNK
jgi:preprotein translocase subunit SecG